MTGEIDPVESVRIQEAFVEAATAASTAAEQVFDIETADYDLIFSDDEDAVAFPAKVESSSRLIVIHPASFDSYVSEYTGRYSDISYLDMAKIHVSGSLIPNAIGRNFKPRDKKYLPRLLDHMTTTDVLVKQICSSDMSLGLDTTEILKHALLAMPEENIGKINSLRLAIGALVFTESQTSAVATARREQLDFHERLVGAFQNGLQELPLELQRYLASSSIFHQDEDGARLEFVSSISVLEIAAAFPMDFDELSVVASFIHKVTH